MRKLGLLLLTVCLTAASAFAQQPAAGLQNVAGKVVNAGGDPMVGVSVSIQGTTRGATTDANGLFVIPRVALPARVDISSLGYEPQRITVETSRTLSITMYEAALETETVVVTGMQDIRERDMTGAYNTFKADSLVNNGLMTLEQMLQGQAAGVVVSSASGLVGTRQQVRVRGTSTLLGNQDVLWVVDGIVQTDPLPFKASDLNNFVSEPGSMDMMRNFVGSAISWLNPSDIDQITILKDAASTVLYGVKAANGVIVITTKTGEAGRMSVNYRGGVTVAGGLTYEKMNLMNSQQRIDVSREIYNRRLIGGSSNNKVGYEGLLSQFQSKEIGYDQFNSGVKYLEQVNTDWFDALFRNPISHTHSLSLSGGEEKVQYYVSLNGSQNKGTAKGNEQNSYGASTRLTAKLAKNVTLSMGLSGSIAKTKGFYQVNPYQYASTTSRAIPLYNDDGSLFYYQNPQFNYNVLNELDNTGNDNELRSMNLNANLRWDVVEGLSYESTFGLNSSNSVAQTWASEKSYYVTDTYRGYEYGQYGSSSPEYQASPLPHGGELNTSEARATSLTWRNQLAWNRVFNEKHRLGVMAGTEMRTERRNGKSDTFFGYMPDMGLGFAQPPLLVNSTVPNRDIYDRTRANIVAARNNYLSFYGNATYSFDERYVATASIRNDASNRFGQDRRNRFLPVWTFGARWNIHNESWMQNQNIISEMNLHGSYGWQGNVAEGYGPELLLSIPNPAINSYTGEPVLYISNMPYADLRWEKTGTLNIGTDIGLFNNRFMLTAEYYRKNTKDMIVLEPLAWEYGVAYVPMNGGTMLNYGWELSLGGSLIRNKDFVWTMSLNTAKNYNEVTSEIDRSADWEAAVSGRLYAEGYAANSLWAFDFAGINQQTGAPMFNIPTKEENPAAVNDVTQYMKYMGSIDPDFSGGLSTSFRYKTFTLAANFNLSLGGKRFLYNMFKDVTTLPSPYSNLPAEFADRWTPQNTDSTIPGLMVYELPWWGEGGTTYAAPRVGMPDGTTDYTYSIYNYSTERVADASFFRCNNISLSYNFTKPVLDRLKMKNLSLTASVTNPFIIVSKDFKGLDPEVATGGQPITKVWAMSVNIGF